MARYERGDEFWDYSRDGVLITIVTGKIGSDGEKIVEQLASVALAQTRERVLLNKQARDGWKLWKPPTEPIEPPAPALPPAPIVHDARNPELEAAIAADPENVSLYDVYGDWLQSQGDPRGKLIALEIAAADKPPNGKHAAAVDRFEKEHGEYLYGGVDRDLAGLRRGFVSWIEIRDGELAPRLRVALAAPVSRFVTRIEIDRDSEGEGWNADLAAAIAAIASAPETLRRLSIGGEARIESLDAIAKRLPELREFSLATVGSREMSVDAEVVKTIVKSRWPRLERLTIEFAAGSAKASELEPLFARTDLPKLRALYLRTPFDGDLMAALATSPLAAQLEELGVSFADTYNADVDALAMAVIEALPALPELKRLDLPLSRCSREFSERIKPLSVKVEDGDVLRFDSGYE